MKERTGANNHGTQAKEISLNFSTQSDDNDDDQRWNDMMTNKEEDE